MRRPEIEVVNNNISNKNTLCFSSADLREQRPRFVCRDLFLGVLTICSCRTYTRRPLLESGIVRIPRLARSSGGRYSGGGGVSGDSRGRLQRVCGRTDLKSPGARWNFRDSAPPQVYCLFSLFVRSAGSGDREDESSMATAR